MSLIVDGFDLSGLGFHVGNDIATTRRSPSRSHPFLVRPGRDGSVPTTTRPRVRPKPVQIGGWYKASTATELQDREDELKHRLEVPDEVEVYLSSRPDRRWDVRVEDLEVTPINPQVTSLHQRVRISGLALHPYARSAAQESADFTAVQIALPVGTARSRPTITITGPVTDPSIIYRAHDGTIVEQMDFTITLADNTEQLIIKGDALDIEDEAGTRRLDALSAGDFIVIDPADASGYGGTDPTLEISPQPGTGGSAVATYFRRWR